MVFSHMRGPRTLLYPNSEDITCPMMKTPIVHMKNAIVGSAKT